MNNNINLSRTNNAAKEIANAAYTLKKFSNFDYQFCKNDYQFAAERYKDHSDENYAKAKSNFDEAIKRRSYYVHRLIHYVINAIDSITDYIEDFRGKADMTEVSHILAKIYGNIPDIQCSVNFHTEIHPSVKKCWDAVHATHHKVNACTCTCLLDAIDDYTEMISEELK